MNKSFYIFMSFVIFLSVSGAGCSQSEKDSVKSREIKIIDKNKRTKGGELIIDATDFEGKLPLILTAHQSSIEDDKAVDDGSQIKAMFDAFGNKTEIRTFADNPLVQCIISRTAADGRRQVFVYGQNGEVRNLPEESFDQALTASGLTLARSAGIFMGRKVRELPAISEPEAETPVILSMPRTNSAAPETENDSSQVVENKTEQIAAVPETPKETKAPQTEDKTSARAFLMDLQNAELRVKKPKPQKNLD